MFSVYFFFYFCYLGLDIVFILRLRNALSQVCATLYLDVRVCGARS